MHHIPDQFFDLSAMIPQPELLLADEAVSMLDVSVRAQVLATKLLPHKLVMYIWLKQQKKL